jgi:hypothetical protein
MSQQHFATAVASQTKLLHDFSLFGIRDTGTIEVGPFTVAVSLEFLEAALVVEPFVGQHLTTVHTAHGDDHRIIVAGDLRPPRQL